MVGVDELIGLAWIYAVFGWVVLVVEAVDPFWVWWKAAGLCLICFTWSAATLTLNWRLRWLTTS